MAEQYGEVVALRGSEAEVQVLQSEACAHCQLCDTGKTRLHRLEIPNRAGAGVGDVVLLEAPAQELLLAACIAWLIPLAAMGLGLAVGYLVGGLLWPAQREMAAAVVGLGMLPLGYLGVKRASRAFGQGKMLAPAMVRVVAPDEPVLKGLRVCGRPGAPD